MAPVTEGSWEPGWGRAVSPATCPRQSCACLKPGQLAGRGDDRELGIVGILRLPGTFAVPRGAYRRERAHQSQSCAAASEIACGSATQSPAPQWPSQAEALST